MEAILEGERVGVALNAFTPAGREAAVERLLALAGDPATAARCRTVALEHFSVEQGVAAYRAIWSDLAA